MKKIDVFYNGWGEYWRLGQLADNGRILLFEYSQEAQHQGLELSPVNLKLRHEAYGYFPEYQMRLPGLIADSLPDGWGLLLMDKLFRLQGINISDISPIDRLAYLGNRSMGALSFVPALPQEIGIQKSTLVEIAKEVQKVISGEACQSLAQLALLGGSPHGARPKVLVDYNKKLKLISTDPTFLKNPWLVKFPAERENKEVCGIEFLYNHLAKKAGLEVNEAEYFDLGKSLSAFGIKRFDRKNEIRIPTHTLSGVLHADFRRPSSVDYLSFLRLTRLMTKDEREVIKAFRQCVFNVVFNNRVTGQPL